MENLKPIESFEEGEKIEPEKNFPKITKNYELYLENDNYSITIEITSNQIISFKAFQINNISYFIYFKEYKYEELLKIFLLQKEYYDNISKIFKFLDNSLSRKKCSLNQGNDKKELKLIIKKTLDYEEIECSISLNKKKLTNEEMIKVLFNEIKEIKLKLLKNNNNNNINNKDKKPENLGIIDRLLEYKNTNNNSFYLSSDNYSYYTFVAYIGLTDNIEYLVYNSLEEKYNINIMRIKDKKNIISLKGHKEKILSIKYYKKDNKTDYLSSKDKNEIIIWDIQNNYNKKFIIQNKIESFLFLFNLFEKDFILLSYKNKNNELYEFKENFPFVKYIFGIKEEKNKTYMILTWFYKNKYYIIELCEKNIFINNIFEDECYAELINANSISGYLYNENYLCVGSKNFGCIRIWDLINKIQIKRIDIPSFAIQEIIYWNNTYSIIRSYDRNNTSNYLFIVNLEEGKIVKRIYASSLCVQKISITQLGECLISSENNYINLYSM